jgi:hypothetical protein
MRNAGTASAMSDFTLMATPTDAVTSVAGNTGVVTNAHIAAAVEAASGSNTFTDADHTKLDGIAASATVDQSASAIKTLLEDGIDSVHYVNASIDNEHLADNAVGTDEIADDAVTADKLANSINTEIAANTAKTGITSGQASAITANTAKVTNATHTGDVTGATALTIAVDAVDIAMLSATGTASGTTFLRGDNTWDVPIGGVTSVNSVTGAVTAANIATAVEAASDSNTFTDADHTKLNAVAASANNYVHPNHSGEVTSTADGATVVADNVIDEANLKVSNAPTNGYVLQAQSGASGGLTWAVDAGGSNVTTSGLWEHTSTIATNYVIASGNNALTAGPITINSSISVTVPTGSTWVIV